MSLEENKMKKILVASPVYEGMDYCMEKFINHLKEIDYPEFEILLVDNSRTKDYYEKLIKIPEIKVIYDSTTEERNIFRVIDSRNKILDYATNNNYDYLLMMDCDVMVPKNILKKLLSHNEEVVSGLYFNYFLHQGNLKSLPVCWKKIEGREIQLYKEAYPGMNLNWISRQLTVEEVDSMELLKVSLPSAGCCLLSRHAFTSGARYGILPIHKEWVNSKEKKVTDDIMFFKQLRDDFKFKIYCDTSIRCEHDIKDKYLNTEGKHPFHEE